MTTRSERLPFLGFSLHARIPPRAEVPPILSLGFDFRIRRLDVLVYGLLAMGILGIVAAMVTHDRRAMTSPPGEGETSVSTPAKTGSITAVR